MAPLTPESIARLRDAIDAPDLDSDRYRVLEPLGRGGMGTVYLAEDRLLERRVALKVLHVEDLGDDGVARMLAEAKTLAKLEHPGIVPVHDLGRLADGRVYYAMKQVRGERLDRHAGAMPVAERLRLFLKLCEAVAFAHAAGVLHLDLKPSNVMVGEFGEVLILDWGIARRRDAAGAGAVAGTPAFMAPEQAEGSDVDERADVFALGATLRFLLGGRAPQALAAVCARATAAERVARYGSVADLAADVERWLEGARPLAHREGPLERAGRFVRRHRVAIALVAAYLVLRVVLWAMAGGRG